MTRTLRRSETWRWELLVAGLCWSVQLLATGCSSSFTRTRGDLLPDGRDRARLVAPYRDFIVLDGDLSDWKGIQFVSVTPQNGIFDPQPAPADSAADLSFRFAVCHDAQALYVAVEVTDDVVVADSSDPAQTNAPAWDDDTVEVFIDGNHNRAPNSRIKDGSELAFGGEFSLVVNGAAMSDYSGWPNSFRKPDHWEGATNYAAIQKGETLARYEFRLSWKVMGGKVRPGDTIGFNISVQDDDDGGHRDHALYWTGIPPLLFLNESGFGDLYIEPR